MAPRRPSPIDLTGSGRERLRRLLRPGVGLKRWLLVIFLGELLIAIAGSLVLRQVVREVAPGGAPDASLIWFLTLQFLPAWLRVVVLFVVGLAILIAGLRRLLETLMEPLASRGAPLVDLLVRQRALARGPRIVAIGGGTGLSTLLRGLKGYSSNLTAIVTVADDGGSSGRLRDAIGLPPMGDIRNCLAALSDAEATMTRLLQYRFPEAMRPGGLGGHALGNLLIAALSDLEGDFEEGVRRMNQVLAVRGQVVPAAPVPLTLHAELADGSRLVGQSAVGRARSIHRVWIAPGDVHATSDAVQAIMSADLIVLGPGSLYTSLLPNLLVGEIREAVRAARAPAVYVVNVATQLGETEAFTLVDHLQAIIDHVGDGVVDAVVANDDLTARAPRDWPARAIAPVLPAAWQQRVRFVTAPVVDPDNAHRHDPQRLAGAIMAFQAADVANAPLAAEASRSA
ncbi:MAG: gluconeogenesis factor YvcK family protein [Candidatus Limnocylindrales bacterium]